MYVGPHLLLANTQGGPPPLRRRAQREMRLPKIAVGPVLIVLHIVLSLSHTLRLQSASRSLFRPRFMSFSIVAVYMPSTTTFTRFFA